LTKILNVLSRLLLNVRIGVQVMSSFKSVVDKLKGLETERRNLLLEIEELKKMADSKARALENEVSMLREEVKSLRVLLGAGEPEPPPEPKRKK
jgi:cell shape-determining protein MreC